MAFGFAREKGGARGYVNESNPEFAPGQRLSRRQYDKFTEKLGVRQHGSGVDAIAETERQLEALRASLAQRASALDQREASLELRERELALEKELFRKGRQSAGQRRYNAALDAYVSEKRRQGQTINKIQARRDPEFNAIMRDLKGRANPRGSPNIRDANKEKRLRALDALGGGANFREYYSKLYGSMVRGTTGSQVAVRARNRARGLTPRRRARGRA